MIVAMKTETVVMLSDLKFVAVTLFPQMAVCPVCTCVSTDGWIKSGVVPLLAVIDHHSKVEPSRGGTPRP